MENIHSDTKKDDQNEGDLLHSSRKRGKLAGSNAPPCISESKSWNLVKGRKPGRTLVLNLEHSEACEKWFQEFFVKRSHGPRITIPKHLVSLDEKYLKRCLELIHMNAVKGASCALSANFSSLDVGFMSDYVNVARGDSPDAIEYAIDYPVDVRGGNLATSSLDDSIVGSVMGSPSMMKILKNPLFQRLGISDRETSSGGTSLFENEKWFPVLNAGNDDPSFNNQDFRSSSVRRSLLPVLNAGQSSASSVSASDYYSQGMLHCRWDGGFPHFCFSLDDQKELYVARASIGGEMSKDMAIDYLYTFHLKPNDQRMFDFSDSESDLIGKMKVSTSFSVSSNNSRIMETEFVMVDVSENNTRDMCTLSQQSRRSRRLSKVKELFNISHSIKQRTLSLFDGSSAIPEDFSTEKRLDGFRDLDQQPKSNISENEFLPNHEMAAIVVKDRIFHSEAQKREETAGWGLKFLKKVGVKKKVASSIEASSPSERSPRNVGDCSTSMNIIVPSGPHGGPRRQNGGPSSLIQRWKSGGKCDCGGWDVGCPLKVLKASPRTISYSDAPGDCKSFHLFTEGIKQETPTLKMVTIHDGLYFISFHSSSLSPLQCFSIAVAIIHSRSPTLRRKHEHEHEQDD